MKNTPFEIIKQELNNLKAGLSDTLPYRSGYTLFAHGQCKILSRTDRNFEFSVDDKHGDFFVKVRINDGVHSECSCRIKTLCRHQIAAYHSLYEVLAKERETVPADSIKYSRRGMIRRVIEERRLKAQSAQYSIEFADNIYGEHVLTNEKGKQYLITFRDLKRRHGYCSCPDYRTNKLGTCKHLIFAFDKLFSEHNPDMENLPDYPFIEIFLNPFRENMISWFSPQNPVGATAELLYRYFGNKNFIEENEVADFAGFLNHAGKYKQILIRPEVPEKVSRISELLSLEHLQKERTLDFAKIKSGLLPFQKEGINFATFKTGAVIADEMGLGKAVQAIGTAMMKKQIFGFTKTLIVCSESVIDQWTYEIHKFTDEKVKILGIPVQDCQGDTFFNMISYEALCSDDAVTIKECSPDLLILDDAQRILNYENPVFANVKAIHRKHILALTGDLAQSNPLDLYSLILLVDPFLLSPLWEFSYEFCFFDKNDPSVVTGFSNVDKLNQKLSQVVISRQKHEVVDQLPTVSRFTVPVKMQPEQIRLHTKSAYEALTLIQKSPVSIYDIQQFTRLVNKMRMVCNSTFLVDNSTNIAPKLAELDHILHRKLNIHNSKRKVVIFTSWKRMLNIIAKTLEKSRTEYLEITPGLTTEEKKQRINRFQNENRYKILLLTDAAVRGLDLEITDTLIHFDAAFTSEEKNLRLGNIGKTDEQSPNLTIIELTAAGSIESWAGESVLGQSLLDRLFEMSDSKVIGEPSPGEIQKLKVSMEDLYGHLSAMKYQVARPRKTHGKPGQMVLDFSEEETEPENALPVLNEQRDKTPETNRNDGYPSAKELKRMMKNGVGFLSELLKLKTGRDISVTEKDIDVKMDEGEIIVRFRFKK